MRIGIDCRLSGLAHAGIGRYIENLIQRLPRLAPDIEWVYFFHQPQQLEPLADLDFESHLVPIRHYSVAEQLKLPPVFKQAKLDLLHVPHFNAPLLYGDPLVITIHDLLWHQQRGRRVTTLKPWQYWPKYLAYRFVTAQNVSRAKRILVPTQTIKQTLSHYYPQAKNKTTVTLEGVDQRILQFKDEAVEREEKTLLYVGSLYPHKNVELILRALEQLPGWKLKIVSARDAFVEKTEKLGRKLGVESQLKFTGYLSDQDLAQQIQAATALVQPSLSEGFGLTGLEALALRTPVLASQIEIFKEVYQGAALYFDPHSVKSFLDTLCNLPQDKPDHKEMKIVVERYSWDGLAKKTLETYLELLES